MAVCVALWGSQASAQGWREAYAAGDYQRAAALIQPMLVTVVSFDDGIGGGDAAAFETLADMYATGRGVEQDVVLACAVMDHAARAARGIEAVKAVRSAPPGQEIAAALRYTTEIERLDERRAELCGRLGEADRAASMRLLACPTASFPRHFYDVGQGRAIEVDRSGIRMRHADGEGAQPHLECPLAFELVRYSRIDPPAPSKRPARHVLELFTWVAVSNETGERRLALTWRAFEIVDVGLRPRARETVGFAPFAWPPRSPPPSATTVDFTIDAGGDLRWKFTESGGPSGVFERESRR